MLFAAVRPALFALDAETAHRLTVRLLAVQRSTGFQPAPVRDPRLAITVAGLDFANPVGLAAGVDKDAEAIAAWFALGFGHAEVGTLTPLPQPGNPKPRLFRLRHDRAVVNRMGFNNGGLAAARLRIRSGQGLAGGVLGVNVGANKDAPDRIDDYETGVAAAAPLADYVTINVSSPNTPGLRDLQHGAMLTELLVRARAAAGATPLFLKVAPDLTPAQIDEIARGVIDQRLDALIIGNTTVTRPALHSAAAKQAGGLSGAPLAPLARARLADFRAATGGAIALVSAGGIDSADEAYARIRAGASLVQLYTALVYEGPGLTRRIATGLARLLARDGFAKLADAVGTAL